MSDQLQFETDVAKYLHELYWESPIVSTSHNTLRKLNAKYDAKRVEWFTRAFFNSKANGRQVFCYDWDDSVNLPHVLIDTDSCNVLGQLVAVDHELVANSAGIQTWSKAQ